MSIVFRLLTLFIFFSGHIAFGQNEEDDFIEYLYKTKKYNQLRVYKRHLKKLDTIDCNMNALNFLVGKSYYHQQLYDSSIVHLRKVQYGSKYNESRFLIGINSIFNNDFETARIILDSTNFSSDELKNLKYFQLAGISLLQKDLVSYNRYNNLIYNEYYFFQKERESFNQIQNDLKSYNEKSPFLAGLYSAILPGAGKFYAGKKGQGIYSFVISSLLAFQAYESFQKAGPKSARFIIYGSLFSLFHVGNVWSSALSVKRYNEEFYEAVDYRIKLDLHIPVRSFFN